MTRLVFALALSLVAAIGCKKDSSSHSHGGETHSHEGDEAHSHDDNKPADPPTKEVPVATSDAGAAAKAAPSRDTLATDPKAEPAAADDADKKAADHHHDEDKVEHDHGKGKHTH